MAICGDRYDSKLFGRDAWSNNALKKSLFPTFQRSLEVSPRAQILIPKNLERIQSKVYPKYTLPAHKPFIQKHAYSNAKPDAKPSESTLQSLQTVSVWLGLMHAAGAETTLKRTPPPLSYVKF